MKSLWVSLALLMAVIARSGWADLINRKYWSTSIGNHAVHNSIEHPITPIKHFYFYQAPEEPKLIHHRPTAVPPKPQKNTKIIFIKVPQYKIIPEIIAPPSPPTNDRTILYILSKQPEDSYVTIPASFGIKHTKPEVYFIKYDNKNEVQMHPRDGHHARQVGTNIPSLQNYLHNLKREQEYTHVTQTNLVPNQSHVGHQASDQNYLYGYKNDGYPTSTSFYYN